MASDIGYKLENKQSVVSRNLFGVEIDPDDFLCLTPSSDDIITGVSYTSTAGVTSSTQSIINFQFDNVQQTHIVLDLRNVNHAYATTVGSNGHGSLAYPVGITLIDFDINKSEKTFVILTSDDYWAMVSFRNSVSTEYTDPVIVGNEGIITANAARSQGGAVTQATRYVIQPVVTKICTLKPCSIEVSSWQSQKYYSYKTIVYTGNISTNGGSFYMLPGQRIIFQNSLQIDSDAGVVYSNQCNLYVLDPNNRLSESGSAKFSIHSLFASGSACPGCGSILAYLPKPVSGIDNLHNFGSVECSTCAKDIPVLQTILPNAIYEVTEKHIFKSYSSTGLDVITYYLKEVGLS